MSRVDARESVEHKEEREVKDIPMLRPLRGKKPKEIRLWYKNNVKTPKDKDNLLVSLLIQVERLTRKL